MKANIQTVQRWARLIHYIQGKPRLMMEQGKRVTLLRIEK